jgi:hypothetical protein
MREPHGKAVATRAGPEPWRCGGDAVTQASVGVRVGWVWNKGVRNLCWETKGQRGQRDKGVRNLFWSRTGFSPAFWPGVGRVMRCPGHPGPGRAESSGRGAGCGGGPAAMPTSGACWPTRQAAGRATGWDRSIGRRHATNATPSRSALPAADRQICPRTHEQHNKGSRPLSAPSARSYPGNPGSIEQGV